MAPIIDRLSIAYQEPVTPDTQVVYKPEDLKGDFIDQDVRDFHDMLMRVGPVPHDILLRYTKNPLREYQWAGDQQRNTMRRAIERILSTREATLSESASDVDAV